MSCKHFAETLNEENRYYIDSEEHRKLRILFNC